MQAVGREVLARLMSELCTAYGNDVSIAALLNTTEVHILASMNPDG